LKFDYGDSLEPWPIWQPVTEPEMKHAFLRPTFILLFMATGIQAQKLAIATCTSSTALSGHDCAKAYDGDLSTDFQGRSTGPALNLDFGKICGIKRIVITWGASRPSGFQINGKDKSTDAYQDIVGIDAVGGPTTEVILPWSQEGYNRDTARYVQIQAYGNVSAMDIKEVSVYGMGVYNEDEILVSTYPFGNVPCSDFTLPTIFSDIFVKRVVGMSTIIYLDDGKIQKLERNAGAPWVPGPTPIGGQPGYNGGRAVFKQTTSGWQVNIATGPYFNSGPNPNCRANVANRGYLAVYYLSHDPDYLTREP
jgi:hypothetical protein